MATAKSAPTPAPKEDLLKQIMIKLEEIAESVRPKDALVESRRGEELKKQKRAEESE